MTVLHSIQKQNNLPRYFSQVFRKLSAIQTGQIVVELPDGRIFQATGNEKGPNGRLIVKNDDLFARILREGNLGFAESYLDGWWTTPDLQALLDALLANRETVDHSTPGSAVARLFEQTRHRLRSNTRRQAIKNIHHHYDLGTAFFDKWLDETMSYSSGHFITGQEDLITAQHQKLELMCDAMDLKEGDHLMDIGCGWGGFALFAARRGARVTGLTISKDHYDFCTDLMAKSGVADRVDIVMRDYRDETGSYDCIGSIEMIEHVGEKFWPDYFKAIHTCLKPGGKATVQGITIADHLFPKYRSNIDFIRKHVFPGGMLPCPAAIHENMSGAGLTHVQSMDLTQSYSKTLRLWSAAFNARWDEIEALGFDQRFKKMWHWYLAISAAGHHYGATAVTQFTMQK
ncbi:MAG: class I SAM-dependent methyltransferase [Rhodobacteraceae bacterium]|nr:class I SAM-dependent methyltransferase [Paracoccaceae bacterium]